jgi:hypothetical protein
MRGTAAKHRRAHDDGVICPNCARVVKTVEFSRWPPDNALATAVCRGCGRNITVPARELIPAA